MISRNELSELLEVRLGGKIPQADIQVLAGEILELEKDWEELNVAYSDMGYSVSHGCSEICWLADQVDRGGLFKICRKKSSSTHNSKP